MAVHHSFRPFQLGRYAVFAVFLSGCGGTGTPSSADASAGSVAQPPASVQQLSGVQTGALEGGSGPAPGFIEGIYYSSSAGSGYTDAAGHFQYLPGVPVQFSVGTVALGTIAGAPVLTPFSFTGDCTMGSELRLMLRFLFGLDVDGEPGNGLRIATVAPSAATSAFNTFTADQLDAIVKNISGPEAGLAKEATAVNDFITLVDYEVWELTYTTDLGVIGSEVTQGVTTDGSGWIFSGTDGMTRETFDYIPVQTNGYAIPPLLEAQYGSNHIGDIDFYNGQVYAPIEDGDAYLSPFVSLYDATTLLYTGNSYAMPQPLLTEGIPWTAVDAARGYLYNAEWNYTININVFDVATMKLLHLLPISEPVDRIQGAKVYQGNLYAASDSFTDKAVYKINLETGTVIKMFSQAPDLNGTYSEFEGISMYDLTDGTSMHTIDKYPDKDGAYFRHFTRTVPPLRQSFCPAGASS